MASGTTYPTTIDSISNKIDGVDDILAAETNLQSSAIEALETKVGADSSAVTSSFDYIINTQLLASASNNYVLVKDSTETNGIKWAANPAGFADPMTTRGDLIYRDNTNNTARLPIGTANYVLTSDGTDVSWAKSKGGGGAGINLIENMIRNEKVTGADFGDAQTNIVKESFNKEITDRLIVDSTDLELSASQKNVQFKTSRSEGYIYDTMILEEAKESEDLFCSIGQVADVFLDVEEGTSTTTTDLTSTEDLSSKFKNGDDVVFVPMRRLKATTTSTKWIQAPGAVFVTLTADATFASSKVSLTHDAITQLPAYDADQLKYICFPVHVSGAYKIEASNETAMTAYTKASPSGYTAINFDKVKVLEDGIAYPSYVHSHWKLNELSGNAINSKQASGTYDLTETGTVPTTTGKLGNARGVFSTSNYFTWNAGGSSATIYDTQNFAVECWFKTSVTDSVQQWIISKSSGSSLDAITGGWSLGLFTNGYIYGTKKDQGMAGSTDLRDGLWHHVLRIQIATSGANNSRMYVDGSLVVQTTGASMSVLSTNDLTVGVREDFAANTMFQGEIDSIAYWSTVPSTWAEVEAIVAQRYASGRGREYGSNIGQMFSTTIENVTASEGDRISFASGLVRNTGYANTPSLEHYAYKL